MEHGTTNAGEYFWARGPVPHLSDPARHCVDVDTELFFPVSETGPALRAAQAVCAGCPLAEQCRQWATDAGEWGIWAGSTTDERRADRRRAREAAAAEASPAEVAA